MVEEAVMKIRNLYLDDPDATKIICEDIFLNHKYED